MVFFDFLFSKKEEEEPEVEIIEEKEIEDSYDVQGICGYCEKDINTNEKMKKFSNGTFHKKCFKKMRKDATKVAFG